MTAVILGGQRSDHFFGEDLGLDRETSQRVIVAIRRVVKDSFANTARESIKETDVRQRSKICEKWFRELHGLGWTVSRILGQDGFPLAFACELAGLHFAPAETLEGYRTYQPGRVPWDKLG